jgi:hypothetical protein
MAAGSRPGRVVEVKLPRNFLALVQIVEYLRAFLMARLALSRMQVLTIISGAFGLFRRDLVLDVGGYSHGTVGEDMELVVKLHRLMRDRKLPYRIEFIPDPVCWTEAPEDVRVLGRQRARWQRGALETFFRHKDMLFNPRYGRIGFLGFGRCSVVDLLGPDRGGAGLRPGAVALRIGAAGGGISARLSRHHLLLRGVFISVATLILEEIELRRFPRARDLAVLTAVAIAENFGYRQTQQLLAACAACGSSCASSRVGHDEPQGVSAPLSDLCQSHEQPVAKHHEVPRASRPRRLHSPALARRRLSWGKPNTPPLPDRPCASRPTSAKSPASRAARMLALSSAARARKRSRSAAMRASSSISRADSEARCRPASSDRTAWR